MHVYCVQHDIHWENKTATIRSLRDLISGSRFDDGSLVIFPEMFSTGFSFNRSIVVEGTARAAEKFLRVVAKERRVYVMGGVVAGGTRGKPGNECVVFSPDGSEVARYRKLQPFAPGGEADNFSAGKEPLLFRWHGCLVAPFICYDLRFPEIQRPAARAGAQLMTFIASWPDARLAHWVKLLQARAIENQCWVAGVNRIGHDPHLSYSGRSLIVNPHGEIVADAGDDECVIGAEVDLESLAAYRHDKPFLGDIRSDYVPARKIRIFPAKATAQARKK